MSFTKLAAPLARITATGTRLLHHPGVGRPLQTQTASLCSQRHQARLE